jgi:subtilase family serine protease
MTSNKIIRFGTGVLLASLVGMFPIAFAGQPLDGFEAHPPIHVRGNNGHGSTLVTVPSGLSPSQIKAVYNLPAGGGSGTIAIVDAYDNPNAEADLNTFSAQFGLPACTTANHCFTKVSMAPGKLRADKGWALESALDTQWAHAIAPGAKILLVEAKSASGNDLLAAVDYARNRADVVAVSMSWGGSEFSGESSYDSHFVSSYGVAFFASSGDSGAGVSWPAASSNVIGVGGTTLNFINGIFSSETAWSGSGGGLSKYELQPGYQATYGVPQANGKRAVPDVSYNADYQNSGVSVYDSYGYKGWLVVGGTSAGAPQWAAIKALGGSVANTKFYVDAASISSASYFRDITIGTNGTCGLYCTAQAAYDYVTGLGSPIAISF